MLMFSSGNGVSVEAGSLQVPNGRRPRVAVASEERFSSLLRNECRTTQRRRFALCDR